jgi:carbamoyltransferase
MILLGIFGPGPNSSSCLLVNGKLSSLVEEERLNRIKTSPHNLPLKSMQKCLELSKLDISKVDYICVGWDCYNYDEYLKKKNQKIKEKNINYFYNLNSRFLYNANIIKSDINIFFKKKKHSKFPKFIFLPHHLCHASSSIYCTNFERANIISIDGSGENLCTVLYEFNKNSFKILKSFSLPHSLGGFYATFTEFLGFKPNQDEGKTMGLAGYGSYSESLQRKLDKILFFDKKKTEYFINPKLRYDGPRNYGHKFTDKFIKIFGKPREKEISALSGNYPNIAYNVQKRLEDVVISLAKFAYEKNGITNFCMAGGVAMNCKLNGLLIEQTFIKNFFCQPASSDNGIPLGACLYVQNKLDKKKRVKLDNLYYGPGYKKNEIKKILLDNKIKFQFIQNIEKKVANLILKKKIIARFSGRMEFGARALGNRSILASPYFRDIREFINIKVKKRENWRPFCPSVLEEDFNTIFLGNYKPKFMNEAVRIKKKFKKKFPSCVHIDDTVRVQVVNKKTNFKFWKLLKEFKKITGYGMIINTSFNVQGEPIVCSPSDALRTFYSSGLDYLVLENFLIKK